MFVALESYAMMTKKVLHLNFGLKLEVHVTYILDRNTVYLFR
jgi:hypothetical protein